jgi:pimeloyl-ACP methyl ester carboxylesterase
MAIRTTSVAVSAAIALLTSGCARTIATTPPAVAAAAQPAVPVDASQALLEKAAAAGATDLTTQSAEDGGIIVDGKIQGNQFALAFPAGWRGGEAMVYAHGYSAPGIPVAVVNDPLVKNAPGAGIMKLAFGEGLAVGHSAYAKEGLSVESGTINTKRLRDLLVKLGASRVYVVGDSMGGSIVVTLLEDYPGAFAGGLARCGVVSSWETLFGQLYDMRASYNFLTRGTPYALPGAQNVTRSALPAIPASQDVSPQQAVMARTIEVATPVLNLFMAARKNPSGREAQIIRQVAAIGGFAPDPAAVATPLVTAALGADDIAATTGGVPYDNMGKVYESDTMTPEEARALNAGIQRSKADPAALAYVKKWHQTTGLISDPLVTIHNAIDALVPYSQEIGLKKAVDAAGRSQYLAAYTVPPMRAPLPVPGFEGYTHCGFTPDQLKASWDALHDWVRTGRRPAADAVK